jgi:hypothetical protein
MESGLAAKPLSLRDFDFNLQEAGRVPHGHLEGLRAAMAEPKSRKL